LNLEFNDDTSALTDTDHCAVIEHSDILTS
jgi:hypothetical protein